MKSVYVVTLFSGENELRECIASVEGQIGVKVRHDVISNLPNREAHQELYRRFNEVGSDFDFMAKLDADMKFATPDALVRILDLFENGIDVVSVTVWDRITDTDMQSFNVFRSRCKFSYLDNDPLFTDMVPTIYSGRHLSLVDRDRRVHHAFNPSPYQAFCFGVHRALKVVQRGASVPRIGSAYYQWGFIRRAYVNFSKNADVSAKFAILGASAVLRGDIHEGVMQDKNAYVEHFSKACESGVWWPFTWLTKFPQIIAVAPVLGANRFARSVLELAKVRLLGNGSSPGVRPQS